MHITSPDTQTRTGAPAKTTEILTNINASITIKVSSMTKLRIKLHENKENTHKFI